MQNLSDKVREFGLAQAALVRVRADVARLSREIIESVTFEVGPDGAITTPQLDAIKRVKPAPPAFGAAGLTVKRTRAVITDAIRAKVKQLVQAGKDAAEIAKAVKISQASVANIKKQLGLVKKK